jgi:hypothetical protein
MFERFTVKAQRVVVFAQKDARALGHAHIGTEHILLGLLQVEDGVAAEVLGSFEVTHARVLAEVRREIGEGDSDKGIGQIPFTPRAKKVLELALREALSTGLGYIGTEHILLGLARENDGVAARMLLDLGASPEAIRARVLDILGPAAHGSRRRWFPGGRRPLVEMLPPPEQWEYRLELRHALDDETPAWLDGLGQEGWQLTGVLQQPDGVQLVFKRRCHPQRAAGRRTESA